MSKIKRLPRATMSLEEMDKLRAQLDEVEEVFFKMPLFRAEEAEEKEESEEAPKESVPGIDPAVRAFAKTRIETMFTKRSFDISVVRDALQMVGKDPYGALSDQLRPYHCVAFDQMPDEIKKRLYDDCMKGIE